MRLILLKTVNGFVEPLGDNSDFRKKIDQYEFMRWLENRGIDSDEFSGDRIFTKDEFIEFTKSVVTQKQSNGQPYDRYPDVTINLTSFYCKGLENPEFSHVLTTTENKFN